jgi:uridine phosphorylase
VPDVCLLDPDGDIVRQRAGQVHRDHQWACYHTELYRLPMADFEIGVVPRAVGAPFAVLVAEQLFACGCKFLVSVTSAGRLHALREPPYVVLIERALRDEGTSYHYLPPSEFSSAPADLLRAMQGAFEDLSFRVERGATWTTDAPYRETAAAIATTTAQGLLAVEMEAAALYAFASARNQDVLCFALVTNQMAQVEGDFEKGAEGGTADVMTVVEAAVRAWRQVNSEM